MPLDTLLVDAFLALTPLHSAQDRQRIVDALNADSTDIYIPDMPLRTVNLTVDYAVLMFCYPWENNNSFAPYFTRQPRAENYDQSSPDYGNRSFALANQNGIDIMVGYWAKNTTIFDNFRRSISQYGGTAPRVAYSMGFSDANDPAVNSHLDFLWNNEFNLPRYARILDRANNLRFPVIFWGLDQVGLGPGGSPPNQGTPPDPAYLQSLGNLLAKLKGRRTSDGAQPFIIWHTAMLHRYFACPSSLKSQFKSQVINYIDAVYQHEMSIPGPTSPLTWSQVDPNHWENFPYVTSDPGANLNETIFMQKAIANAGNLIATDAKPIIVIPGTMPQYSRERFSKHTLPPTDQVQQDRVNCTSVQQLAKTLIGMGDLSETYRLIKNGLSWRVRRMVALSTWNEYREGTTWEPCAPDSNNPQVLGITDSSGQFLNQAKTIFADGTVVYTIGDDSTG